MTHEEPGGQGEQYELDNLPQRDMPNEFTALQAALSHDFRLSVENLSPLNAQEAGDHSNVYRGKINDRGVVVKVGTDPGNFEVEMSSLDISHEQGIPSPTTVDYRRSARFLDRPVVIQTAVPGIALAQMSSVLPLLWEQAGRTLQQINAITVNGFGHLKVDSGQLIGNDDNFVLSHMPDIPYLAEQRILNDTDVQILAEAQARLPQRAASPASFLHNDFQGANIFTDGVRITGVIDIASPRAGDPRHDIALAHVFMPNEAIPSFNRGYGSLSENPLVSDYYLLITAGKVAYRHKRGFTDRLPSVIHALKTNLISKSKM